MVRITVDGDDASFECSETDSILRGALRQGVDLPYECNSGGCGSCKFDLLAGKVETDWEDPPGLSTRDKRKGRLLACQSRPQGDCTIKTRLGPEVTTVRPQRFTARFREARRLTEEMSEFVFLADGAAEFLPGQFALVTLPGIEGDRAYSMSNTPNAGGEWSFIIKNMPGGAGSAFMFNTLAEGDELSFDGPFGHAYLREDNGRDVVLVAGGSGLSPVISILRFLAKRSTQETRKVFLFYGGRRPQDLCTDQLVDALGPLRIDLSCHTAVSDSTEAKAAGWEGPCCFVHELLQDHLGPDMTAYDYYFCGPPPMTEAVQRLVMIDHQVPFDQVHFDRFF